MSEVTRNVKLIVPRPDAERTLGWIVLVLGVIAVIVALPYMANSHYLKGGLGGLAGVLIGFCVICFAGPVLNRFYTSQGQIKVWEKFGLPENAFPQNLDEMDAARKHLIKPFLERAAFVAALGLLKYAIREEIAFQQNQLENFGRKNPWQDLDGAPNEWREEKKELEYELDMLYLLVRQVDYWIQTSRDLLISVKDTLVDNWGLSECTKDLPSTGAVLNRKIIEGFEACLNALEQESFKDRVNDLIMQAGFAVKSRVFALGPGSVNASEGHVDPPRKEPTLLPQEA